jgi:predicted amidophosphoribosyltransferase
MAEHTLCPHCGNMTATIDNRCAVCEGRKVHNLGAVSLEVEEQSAAPKVKTGEQRKQR